MFNTYAAGGDTVETGVRSCVLPSTIMGFGCARSWYGHVD